MVGRYFDNPAEDPDEVASVKVEVITISDDEQVERKPEPIHHHRRRRKSNSSRSRERDDSSARRHRRYDSPIDHHRRRRSTSSRSREKDDSRARRHRRYDSPIHHHRRRRRSTSSRSRERGDSYARRHRRYVSVSKKPKGLVDGPPLFRPVVIDGSSIAKAHEKPWRGRCTFSIKGIKLAIDFFLKCGHTDVCAFIPRFRHSRNKERLVPTTGFYLFDDLQTDKKLILTPSGSVNGRRFVSDVSRYILQVAADKGGLIVSNRKFAQDLLNENVSFKEAVQQRLFKFRFDGDNFTVVDPLKRSLGELVDIISNPNHMKSS